MWLNPLQLELQMVMAAMWVLKLNLDSLQLQQILSTLCCLSSPFDSIPKNVGVRARRFV